MRVSRILTVAVLSLACVPLAAYGQADPNAAILAELQALRKDAAEIKADQAAIKKDVADLKTSVEAMRKESGETKKAAQLDVPGLWDRPDIRGPDLKRLREITLPENATDEQARKYIQDIIAATEDQNSFSDRDPQPAMFAKVGPDRIRLLIEALEKGDGDGNGFKDDRYLVPAIRRIASDKNKNEILDSLETRPALVNIVTAKRWEQDAKGTLLKVLAGDPDDLPTEWIVAVARLKDPKTYDDLKAYLVNGSSKESTYKAICTLPGIDLADSVRQAWQNVGANMEDWEARGMAFIAMEYGHLDALGLLVDWLAGEHPNNDWQVRPVRTELLKRLPFRGTNAEIVEWYNKNKNQLDFDPATKKFVVLEKNKAK